MRRTLRELRDERDRRRAERDPQRHDEAVAREMEEARVQAGHRLAEPRADSDADERADRHDDDDLQQVMRGDRAVAVAKRLQCRDLLALRPHQARDHHVQQERGHAQEDGGNDVADRAVLRELGGDDALGGLFRPAVRARASPRCEQPVQFRDHVRLARARLQLQRDAVERALHVHRASQHVPTQPEHAEQARVREDVRARDLVDELRRDRHAHHAQPFPAAVDDRADLVTGFEPVRLRETLAHEHFVALRRDPAAGAQVERVQHRAALRRDRDQPPVRGLLQPRHVQQRVDLDARLDRGDARNARDAVGQRLRRPLDRREHVREAGLLVEAVARAFERVHRAAHRDHAHHAAPDQRRDRQHLAPVAPQVPQQLPVDRSHQRSSSGLARRAFSRTSPTVPLVIRTTRSAMSAIATLCVISSVVAPSRALTSASARSTSTPVS